MRMMALRAAAETAFSSLFASITEPSRPIAAATPVYPSASLAVAYISAAILEGARDATKLVTVHDTIM
jgi:hypothetical protein